MILTEGLGGGGGGGTNGRHPVLPPPPRSPNLICAARLNLKMIIFIEIVMVSYNSTWNDNAVETKDEAEPIGNGKGIGES